ncbi:hypothetical protein AN639_04490 [Candidatus Epulonipiscium fishelsonii]|uniref:Uncharacterized protein n=1 Tax=Candidatus Epulonipiscium fishelsonii TaxID=77094 RepID=A0ACC8X8X4_9FIRM|nr:hypothetical protein AN396_11180 [Epulopiscium sp. SCG-B11WGA-EpuloA1]ONI40552.1 hypothetical protein AN639_04490 [Epulopiscium sp. SCG-B05WGA-EpuloA1]
MLKKIIFKLLCMLTVTSTAFVGCGSSEDTAQQAITEVSNKKADSMVENETSDETLRLVNMKVEIDAALKSYAKVYEEQTGIKVEIESIGGGTDMNSVLKGYLAADNMPDIFAFGGAGDYNTWKDQMTDLSTEAWTEDTDVEFIGDDSKVVGFPYAIEGYGITYNKDLLDKAGIDPASLTSYSAYEEAFAKLDGMKEELGIDAVVSMAASIAGGMTWSTGGHNFGSFVSTGVKQGDTSIIDALNAGVVPDRARLDQYAKFVDLLFDYSDEYVLISGSYDDQLALWEDQKAVFIHQGNWIDPNLISDGITFNVGIAPSAFLEEETDGILADAPSWWGIYNGSNKIQQAKDFLTAIATTEEGAKALVLDAGMISPFKSVTISPTAPLAKDLQKWVLAEKIYPWHYTRLPEGFGSNELGPIYELLATGSIDATMFADMVEVAVSELQ